MRERRMSPDKSARPVIDSLLVQFGQNDSLSDRIDWLVRLFYWIRSGKEQFANAHLKLLFQVIERNPELKTKIAATLRSIVRDINAFDLFVSTGIATQGNFLAELYERCILRFLPKPPRLHDFAEIVHLLFPKASDAAWLLEISDDNLQRIIDLLHYGETPQDKGWNSVYSDMIEAIFCITRQIQVQSFTPEIRVRIGKTHITELAFYRLDEVVGSVLATNHHKSIQTFHEVLSDCRKDIDTAYRHLDDAGVSVELVYKLDRLQAQLRRIEILMGIIVDEKNGPAKLPPLLHDLAIMADEKRSVRALFRENIALLSKKIVENNAEIGDHYITRNKTEYKKLIFMAMGGGAITCFTVIGKTHLEHLDMNYFSKGFLVSLCYAASFVWIQILGFTLATKQPAMTGAALASKIKQLLESKDYTSIITEVMSLVRSQVAAIFGNVITVAPLLILAEFTYFQVAGSHIIDAEYAEHVIKAHSIFGLTPLYAAMTGVSLWLSSVFAGWVGNWFVFHELPAAIEYNKNLRKFFGWQRTKSISDYLRKNIAALGGNISLGFLLGMTSKVAAFFGIVIDSRHVTLSTGTIALAASVLGPSVIETKMFAFAVAGVIVAGVFNISVSFGLALWVAGRSQRLKKAQSWILYRRILSEFLRKPWRFLLPSRV